MCKMIKRYIRKVVQINQDSLSGPTTEGSFPFQFWQILANFIYHTKQEISVGRTTTLNSLPTCSSKASFVRLSLSPFPVICTHTGYCYHWCWRSDSCKQIASCCQKHLVSSVCKYSVLIGVGDKMTQTLNWSFKQRPLSELNQAPCGLWDEQRLK